MGFKYGRASGHGKLLVRDEPLASIVKEALEGFASGRFESQAEVKRYLESQPAFPKDGPDSTIRYETIIRLLTRVHYAGYIEVPAWKVSLRKGHHDGLISLATYNRIQERIKDGARAPARKDINEDFPLRGFIVCNDCSKALTACWSKSKTGKQHPYYLCFTKGCASYRKSIRRDVLEGEFEALLESLRPSRQLFEVAKAMFRDAWDQRVAQASALVRGLEKEARAIERQIENLLDRIVDAGNEHVVAAYEKRLAKLEREKELKDERLSQTGRPQRPFDEMFELAAAFLANPCNIWQNGGLTGRKTVLRLAFTDRLAYCRNEGLRTPKISLPFKMLRDFTSGNCKMAERMGFEPTRRYQRLLP